MNFTHEDSPIEHFFQADFSIASQASLRYDCCMAIKRIHLLPNIITAFALSCGLFVIFKMNMTEIGQVTYQTIASVSAILLLAALADFLDGAVARAIKAESDFGGIFDSMADAISFGVAPSVIVLKSLSLAPGTEPSFFLTTAAMIFSVCGILRLVRFNIESMQEKGDMELMNARKKILLVCQFREELLLQFRRIFSLCRMNLSLL